MRELTLRRRLGHASTAVPSASFPAAHCGEDEHAAHLDALPIQPAFRRQRLQHRRRFIRLWPDLKDWMTAPLEERVGRLRRQTRSKLRHHVSYQARSYLHYLAFTDRVRLDYDWLLALGTLRSEEVSRSLDLDLGIDMLSREAANLGFHPVSARLAIYWTLSRIALQAGIRDPAQLRTEHVEELLAAVRRFGGHADVGTFYGSAARCRVSPSKAWITHLHQLGLLLYHRGQAHQRSRKYMPAHAVRPPPRPVMESVVDRWLALRRLTNRPITVHRLGLALRCFLDWLAAVEPDIDSFARVTRDHVLGFLSAMASEPNPRTGRPLAAITRRAKTSALGLFFRGTAAMGWDEVPGRPLLDGRDQPRPPQRVPRFIPADELARVMDAIAALECPFQKAALLTALWSGARRSEIQRLALDCLECCPDGTARLRVPAGKTYQERVVPLHEDAATALQAVIALRADGIERAFVDDLSGTPVRCLFMGYGKPLSTHYLFDVPLRRACAAVGLVDPDGHATIAAHRFRHTLGTQLAERGAKLHTIMRVLGHESPSMTMVYARISDPEGLRDYQAVPGPGAVIAGPGAEAVRGGTLGVGAVDWLKTNFLKTELELGHCLRLPAEGPCECNLFFTCSRFVTTPAYAPRLRERRQLELTLADDARNKGWPHEIERHSCIAVRIEKLLADLGLDLST